MLLLIGALTGASGGLPLAMLIIDHPSHQSALLLYTAVLFGAGVVVAVFGDYLWYRAAAATRRPPSQP